MIITTTFLKEHRTQKPSGPEIASIQQKCIRAEPIELNDLLTVILQGGTFRPTECGKTKDSFKSGQLFALDFDNTDAQHKILPIEQQFTPTQAVRTAQAAGFNPFAVYPTFSYSEGHAIKFRMLFVADQPLIDRGQWQHCQDRIARIFPQGVTDHTNEPSRLFFGTDKGIIYADLQSTVSVDVLLSDFKPKQNIPRQKPRQGKARSGDKASRIIQAIASHDSAYIRRKTGRSKRIDFDNRQQFFDYLYKEISIADLLSVEPQTSFSCILPTHGGTDEHPSASIIKAKSGVWIYKCFAEDLTLNIKQLFELLGDFHSEYQVLEFIKTAFNLRIIKSEWSEEQKANIDSIIDCLCATDETAFSVICPTASRNIRHCKMLLIQVLCIARNCIFPERSAQGRNIVFYMSLRQLTSALKRKDIKQTSLYLKLLQYHGLIIELPDEQIPTQMLIKASNGRKDKNHSRISFYEIPSWVVQHTQLIESQGQKWKGYGYRMTGISYEMFLRTEGQEVATRLYPQYSKVITKQGDTIKRTTGRKADKTHELITEIVVCEVATKGYCTEAEILHILQKSHGKTLSKRQISRSIADILTANNLKKVKANKALKHQLCIDSAGYPVVIIQ